MAEIPSSTIVQSSGLPPFLLLPLTTLPLVATIAIFNWRFPCTTVEALQRQGASVQGLLTKAWEEDLLGEMEEQFRQAWRRYRDEIEDIKLNSIQAPDSRSHPIAWIHFHWRQLRTIDACYTALQNLSVLITFKTEMEKRNRRYFTPADVYQR